MIRILIFSFISFLLSCTVFKQNQKSNKVIEYTSLNHCSGRGGGAITFKSIRKDSTTVVKSVRNSPKDTVKYKTDIKKWETLNSLIDVNEFKKEMESKGGNNHMFDGCNNTFTIKSNDGTFSKYNSKIKSEKLEQFYELFKQM